MVFNRRYAVPALIAAGTLWGATVPLSKLALGWLDPAWLTVGRFLIAGLVLAAIAGPRRLRAALSLRVAAAGAAGFGICVAFQNAGIAQTSVSHASVLVGIVPVLVALTSLLAGHGHANGREWVSYGLSLAGIGLIAGSGGGGASLGGDLLVVVSVMLSAILIAMQPRLLAGRDPAAVTAVQFFAAAAVVLPLALSSAPPLSAPSSAAAPLAFIALTLAGTVLPFWLFALGQSHVRPQLAGAFVNLEPVVGAAIGWIFFSNPVGPPQLLGALAVVAAIALAATNRRFGLVAAAGRIWVSSVGAHAALLDRPWEREGPLRWRRRDGAWQLDGLHLPAEPHELLSRERIPEPQA